MSEVSMVFVTVGDADEAVALAGKLVAEKYVACVNMVPRIRSIYLWKGEVRDEGEVLLIMKTRISFFPELQRRIRELHSYEVPEIIALPVSQGLPEYLQWVLDCTRERAEGKP